MVEHTTKKTPWKSANSVPVVKAPCSLLPEAMPETKENAAPDPNADIILRHDMEQIWPCTMHRGCASGLLSSSGGLVKMCASGHPSGMMCGGSGHPEASRVVHIVLLAYALERY